MNATRIDAETEDPTTGTTAGPELPADYLHARDEAERGRLDDARRLYHAVDLTSDPRLPALVANDLAVLAALDGDPVAARDALEALLSADAAGDDPLVRANLDLLRSSPGLDRPTAAERIAPPHVKGPRRVRVAILSFLFNWPSTGGGTVHTYELARFLDGAGYDVRHVYVRFEPWGIGGVEGALPYPSEAVEVPDELWGPDEIRRRVRAALDAFDPDHVIITDSWNSKPLLAEAARGYPYVLRFQASECLCPLNNVRLLPEGPGRFRQCSNHQLANPRACGDCLRQNGRHSGALHRAERALSGVGQPDYHDRLVSAFAGAEAALVVNPLMEAMVSPYTANVRVVTAGMDPDRFPDGAGEPDPTPGRPLRLLFAGLVDEPMKGFDVLYRACLSLRWRRQDFELVVTSDAPEGWSDDFTRFVGWQSQKDLPKRFAEADVVVVPTVAQEALGRTAVEAMAAGRPVVASRLGGLPFTVADGATGLLAEPGDADDLARRIETLLDDAELRRRLGRAGRRRFEEHYAWPVIIERHYRPLLTPRPDRGDFVPRHTPSVDPRRLVDDVAEAFGLDRTSVERMYGVYRAVHESNGYARTSGEVKTLCFEEAFILCVTMSLYRPQALLAVEPADGRALRRIVDIKGLLGLDCRVACFGHPFGPADVAPDEAEVIAADPIGRLAESARLRQAALVYLDRHEHALVDEAVRLALDWPGDLVLALHDAAPGLCNPHPTIAKGDPRVTSATGVWQRHVLAEAFGVSDPLSPALDRAETATHRLRVFETRHGLALITRKGQGGMPPA